MTKMNKSYYQEKQNEWINENHVKIGDTVRVTKAAEDIENGWPNNWVAAMLYAVGKMGRIEGISDYGVEVNISGISRAFRYPYFVLEKVDSEQRESKHKEWEISYGLKARTGDSVLVRDHDDKEWQYSLLSHRDSESLSGLPFLTTGGWFKYCIPYAGNEHLVGANAEWEDPAAETKEKDFRFGAKVQIQIGDKTWEGVMLDYDEQDNSYEIARRDSENTETRRIWVGTNKFTYID